tara:strand:- start:827 stop:1042 length:216 start_codon:yes stop_codon:yes gene_type:complete
MMTKIIETNIVDLIDLEIESMKSGHNGNGKKRLSAYKVNIDLMSNKKDYQHLNGYNRKIHKGYKTLTIDER